MEIELGTSPDFGAFECSQFNEGSARGPETTGLRFAGRPEDSDTYDPRELNKAGQPTY